MIVVGVHPCSAEHRRKDVAAKVISAARSCGIGFQLPVKSTRGKDIVPHRGIHLVWLTGNGGRIFALFMKTMNGALCITLDDPKFNGLIQGNRDRGDRHVSFHAAMKVDHLLDVHAVDVIGTKDGDKKIVCDIEQI